MGSRVRGCLTPAAMLLTAGLLLIIWGNMAEESRSIRYGVGCLAAAGLAAAVAIYFRWQGWG